MKKIFLILAINLLSNNVIAEQKRPDYGKIAIEGMIKGATDTIKNIPKAIEIMGNKINESPKNPTQWNKRILCNDKGKNCKTSYSDK